MAVDNVITNSATGIDGNAYTTQVSNDQLTSEDFLKLMLEEMKMQDPTKPMDSSALMDSQLKMSTIESNLAMSDSLKSMQQSYAASALSTAANMIGHTVEDGSTDDNGLLKSYKVETIENQDGELYANVRQITGIADGLMDSQTEKLTLYDADGYIYDGSTKTNYRLALDHEGRFTYNEDGSLKIVDENNDVVTDEAITSKYIYAGSQALYAENTVSIPLGNIQEVR
jgi:flagellar basal-body rod modification protein FlgD